MPIAIVAIAGMHRSGTSMVTRLLNLCGLYLGKEEDLVSSAEDNPEGFWENTKFQTINGKILTSFGGDWDAPPSLNAGWETSPHLNLIGINQDANSVILENSQHPVWGWKDPRNSLTIAFWKRLIPNLKVIICVRNPFEVYRSLARRGYASSIFSYNLWLTYHQELLTSTQPGERIFTHYDAFFYDPQAELRRLLNFIGLDVSDDVIDAACQTISTNLRHNRSSMRDLYSTNPPDKLLDLYREVCLRAGPVYGLSQLSDEDASLQNAVPGEESDVNVLEDDLPAVQERLKALQQEIRKFQQKYTAEMVKFEIEAEKSRSKIAKLENELTDVYTSRSWRAITIVQQIRHLFFPNGSLQEKILKFLINLWSVEYLVKLIYVLRRQGITGLLLRITEQGNETSKVLVVREGAEKVYDDLISTAKNRLMQEYVQPSTHPFSASESPIKLIAFYLPQFHPIPENDKWWGKGFVEWTNVSKAVPQFVGHYQPHLPGELGFYDLRVPDVQKRQIELARHYGLYGFAFHYYWFNGKRLLEKPLDLFLKSDNDFPFCVCWANENWTRRWDGQENEILIAQEHSPKSDLRFIQDIAPILKDKRYIRINGRPLLIVYRADIIPDINQTVKLWRQYCTDNGIGDPYLVAAQTFWFKDPRKLDFDAAVEFPPHNVSMTSIRHLVEITNPNYQGSVAEYKEIVEQMTSLPKPDYKVFKTVFPGWDNEARKPGSGYTFAFSTPTLYKKWLTGAATITMQEESDPEKRLVFINAWNEWGEGAHLEPDRKYGYAYLQATMDVLNEIARTSKKKSG